MKNFATAASLFALTTGAAFAGGLDRSGQPVGIIFEQGNYGELSFSSTTPTVSGADLATTGTTGNVADSFIQATGGVKFDVDEQLSIALIFDTPFGSDINYPVNATSVLLGGTSAVATATSTSLVARYKFNENFSAHGGLRLQSASGDIALNGLAYGPLAGYNVSLGQDQALGYLVGFAYEKPEIALRIALTYNSAITHKFNTFETLNGAPINPAGFSTTEVETPQSINLDVQSGIAKDTLLFGSVRWAEWSAFRIDPAVFTGLAGGGLVDLEDTVTYTIGVGRKFSDQFSGSVSLTYEAESDDDLVSPLAPTNGLFAVSLGGRYTMDNTVLSGGIRYSWLGDAFAETGTPDTARGEFTDNTALSVGFKIGFNF
ncbi:outer membrane protein transport protein [Alphaproteobacteria bacterium KMM 3653]|uniref:Outer membrane protein transport protein n=1 Tax=Harenicola maris TaxID=2841044 RepID=A0AAP2G7F0_9RHOB|nr:outer membrane protein transport protein [Harenicola maris]